MSGSGGTEPLAKRQNGGASITDTQWAWLFIVPCLLGLVVFTYLPTLASLLLSFHYWNLLGQPEWVGLDNYRQILVDPLFWKSFVTTWIFVIAIAGLQTIGGLLLAVWLNRLSVARGFFRASFFVPFITPMIGVSLVWGWMYDSNHGMLNQLLHGLSVLQNNESIAWLQDPHTALFAVILLQVWKSVGYNMIIFLAGLQGIPEEVYESAELDGASPISKFKSITLPLITPMLFFVSVISLINAFQAFDGVYLLTQGGPQHSTDIMVYWMFKNAFELYKVGPASAIAFVIFIIILVLTLLQWQLRKKWVLYEEDIR